MSDFEFHQIQLIDRPLEEVFAFFAEPRNLERLTPGWLRFKITSPGPIEMMVGTRIDYTLKLRGIPIKWQSEITRWEPPVCFVDEQRRGPYTYWIHTHSFTREDDQTRVTDHVRYAVPGGVLVKRLFVEPDIQRIFSYRERRLREIFADAQSVKS